jgi:predicted  nucleic acid-binding Zn-ribbon protein
MERLQPDQGLFERARAMMHDAWNMRLVAAQSTQEALQKQLRDTERQIDGLLDRVVEASNGSVIPAYEARIEKLERDKVLLSERVDHVVPPKARLEDGIELAPRFLSSS